MDPKLSQIFYYPIKSCAGISSQSHLVEILGLSDDRRFVICDLKGKMITGRSHPQLTRIKAHFQDQVLRLEAAAYPSIEVNMADFSESYQDVQIWKDNFQGQFCHRRLDQWLSDYLLEPVKLLYFGEQSTRFVKNRDTQVAFADAYPLLLISEASLAELNQRSDSHHSMEEFRPNIVVKDTQAFAEDHWRRIRIGEVEFEITTPCSRCIFTTLDLQEGEFRASKEPLVSLESFRQGADRELYFGQNLVALNSGTISVGDTVEVLETQTPERYLEKPKKLAQQPQAIKESQMVDILFDSWDKMVKGNTEQTILEQAEEAGVDIDYSCQSGYCGTCKVKLESGDVERLEETFLTEQETDDGYILACSCIPKSNLVISQS